MNKEFEVSENRQILDRSEACKMFLWVEKNIKLIIPFNQPDSQTHWLIIIFSPVLLVLSVLLIFLGRWFDWLPMSIIEQSRLNFITMNTNFFLLFRELISSSKTKFHSPHSHWNSPPRNTMKTEKFVKIVYKSSSRCLPFARTDIWFSSYFQSFRLGFLPPRSLWSNIIIIAAQQ